MFHWFAIDKFIKTFYGLIRKIAYAKITKTL